MSTILVAMASMLALTALAWVASRVSRFSICPVCIGVSGTWLALLAARFAGIAVDATVLGILLGATVLGVVQWRAGQLQQGGSALLWKALAIPIGSVAAYGLVAGLWGTAALAGLAFALLALAFQASRQAPEDSAAVSQLEERMKRCC